MTDTTDDLAHLDARIDLIREQRDAMERIAAERAVASDRNLARWTSATDALHKATADLNATREKLTTAEASRDSLQAEVNEIGAVATTLSAEREALRAEVDKLRARPVLTVGMYRARIDSLPGRAEQVVALLGPVTLPAQDRAEELARAVNHGGGWPITTYAMSSALASLGAPATTPSKPDDVFAGVSIEELAGIYAASFGATTAQSPARIGAIRAVLDALRVRLVEPVDPIVVATEYHDHPSSAAPRWMCDDMDGFRADAARAMRATLTAKGIPVTPEAGK